MAQINQHKVVASLPDPLEANSIYYVRVGEGFDIYVTNGSGVVVEYSLNAALAVGEIQQQIGDISAALDAINGEVI